ncbi:MAG: Ankyrin repeat-containing protein [candidate division TM6 bacterium GW2011_GWE2_42_60]|nr:MAG: Ankyrin repeat-containing protein [candidate division TM6 bacterium GW2011_GWE2_42_60]HBY06218.1 hypothetical protein [Candidatus Dependentiae bacterium]
MNILNLKDCVRTAGRTAVLLFATLSQITCFATNNANKTDEQFYTDTFGWTKLHQAIVLQKSEEELKKLLPISLPREIVNKKDYAGRIPGHLAIMCGNKAAIKLLNESGKSDPNAQDFFGLTPADYDNYAESISPRLKPNTDKLLPLFAPLVYQSEILADRFFDDSKTIVVSFKQKTKEEQEELCVQFINNEENKTINFNDQGITPASVYKFLAAFEIAKTNNPFQLVTRLEAAQPCVSYLESAQIANKLELIQIDQECIRLIKSCKKSSFKEDKSALFKLTTSLYDIFETELSEDNSLFFNIIIAAIKQGLTDVVETLLFKKPDLITAIDTATQKNFLHYAAESGNHELVNYFIQTKKIKLDAQDILGNSALHYAATSGNLETVKLLYCAGANVNIFNNEGLNALLYCTISPQYPTLSATASFLTYQTESDTDYALCNITENRSPEQKKQIFDKNKKALFLAQYATYYPNLSLILAHPKERLNLLINNSSKNVVDKFIAYILTSPQHTPNKDNKHLYNFLTASTYLAASKKVYLDIALEYAKKHEEDLENIKANILKDACQYGSLDAVKECVETHKIPINRRELLSKDTVVHTAAKYGKADIVEYLIQKDVSKNTFNDAIETPYDCINKNSLPQNINPITTQKMQQLLKPSYWSRVSQFIRCCSSKDDSILFLTTAPFLFKLCAATVLAATGNPGWAASNFIWKSTDLTINDEDEGLGLHPKANLLSSIFAEIPASLCYSGRVLGLLLSASLLLDYLQGERISPYIALVASSTYAVESIYSLLTSSLTYKKGPLDVSRLGFRFKTNDFSASSCERKFLLSFYRTCKIATLATGAASTPARYSAFLCPVAAFEALKLWYMTPCVDWDYQTWKQKLFGSKIRTALTLGTGAAVTGVATALLARRYPQLLTTLQTTGKWVSTALPLFLKNRTVKNRALAQA